MDFFPKDVRTFGYEQVGRDQLGFLTECQRLWCTVLFNHPFDGDAGIDDERIHRSLRASTSNGDQNHAPASSVPFRSPRTLAADKSNQHLAACSIAPAPHP